MFHFESKGRKMSQLNSQAGVLSYSKEGQPFNSTQVFNLFDEAHPHWEGQSAFCNLLIQILVSSKNSLTDTPRIIFGRPAGRKFRKELILQNIWTLCGPAMLTHKINIARPLTTHLSFASSQLPWTTSELQCALSTWLLWEQCLPESPSLCASRTKSANRGRWVRLGEHVGSGSHCSAKDIIVARSERWSQRCLMGSSTSSVSFATLPALLPNC